MRPRVLTTFSSSNKCAGSLYSYCLDDCPGLRRNMFASVPMALEGARRAVGKATRYRSCSRSTSTGSRVGRALSPSTFNPTPDSTFLFQVTGEHGWREMSDWQRNLGTPGRYGMLAPDGAATLKKPRGRARTLQNCKARRLPRRRRTRLVSVVLVRRTCLTWRDSYY